MKKGLLIKLINDGLSIRKIQQKTNESNSKVRYWLNKYELKTLNKKYNKKDWDKIKEKWCPKCENMKPIKKFYKMGGDRNRMGGYCKKCSNLYHQNRVRLVKIKMINYKGGECIRCSLNLKESNYFVFDFHHRNSLEKDPNFNKIKFQKWSKIKKEIDKCDLLCSNCHRTIHYEILLKNNMAR